MSKFISFERFACVTHWDATLCFVLPPAQKSQGTSCCCLRPSTPPPTLRSYCKVTRLNLTIYRYHTPLYLIDRVSWVLFGPAANENNEASLHTNNFARKSVRAASGSQFFTLFTCYQRLGAAKWLIATQSFTTFSPDCVLQGVTHLHPNTYVPITTIDYFVCSSPFLRQFLMT